jgi:membrane fusion protein, multidrug efflux system
MAEADQTINVDDSQPLVAKPKRKWARLMLMLSLPLILIVGGVAYYLANDHYVSTDNAYVQQDKVSVSAEVGGRITEVAVHENEQVKAGALLFRIDPAPFLIAVAQADATMAAAQVRMVGLETDYQTTGVDIASAREDVSFFEKEYRRQSELMQRGFTTRARLQAAEHSLSDARSKVADAQSKAMKARAAMATGAAVPGENPMVASARVQKQSALLNLSRTEVRAPIDGVISQADRLQVGQTMVTGLPAVSIVASNRSWVEANFKETDLNNMQIGQSAVIKFDAYPDMKVTGHVVSIGAGTGSEFSVLPAQNANGNWVKVTQRVPVRIAIDGKPGRLLIAGLSAHIRIDTSSNGKRR